MNLLLFILLMFFVVPMMVSLINKLFPPKSAKPGEGHHVDAGFATVVRKVKVCPPHQWFSQEIRDTAGNKLGDRLVCKLCGPLKPQGENYE